MLKILRQPLFAETQFASSKELLNDLELSEFLGRFFESPLRYITCDKEAIVERNEICKALLRNEGLVEVLRKFYDISLAFQDQRVAADGEPIQIIRSMIGVRLFWDTTISVIHTIANCKNLPDVFLVLANDLTMMLNKLYPANFDEAWDKYAFGVQLPASISFRMHFSENLMVESIALASVSSQKFTKKNLLSRFGNAEALRTLSLTNLFPTKYSDPDFVEVLSNSVHQIYSTQSNASKNQMKVLERRIASELKDISNELCFILGMVECARALNACSQHTCFAEILDKSDCTLCAENIVHPVLSEKIDVVANSVVIDNTRQLILLGGVNMGGKTTYLRTIGAMQLLFQLGLPIPASQASISLVTGIYSVFAREEDAMLSEGKLGRELSEMRDAVSALNENTLFLGNEPISATSPEESYYLSRESLCMLKAKCVRGIWVTHLFELFDDASKLNELPFGSQFQFMHTSSIDGEQKYIVRSGLPEKYSGAKDVFMSV